MKWGCAGTSCTSFESARQGCSLASRPHTVQQQLAGGSQWSRHTCRLFTARQCRAESVKQFAGNLSVQQLGQAISSILSPLPCRHADNVVHTAIHMPHNMRHDCYSTVQFLWKGKPNLSTSQCYRTCYAGNCQVHIMCPAGCVLVRLVTLITS